MVNVRSSMRHFVFRKALTVVSRPRLTGGRLQGLLGTRNMKRANSARYKDMRFIPRLQSDKFEETGPFTIDAAKKHLKGAYVAFKTRCWHATTQSPETMVVASYSLRMRQRGFVGLSQPGGVTRRFNFITHTLKV